MIFVATVDDSVDSTQERQMKRQTSDSKASVNSKSKTDTGH